MGQCMLLYLRSVVFQMDSMTGASQNFRSYRAHSYQEVLLDSQNRWSCKEPQMNNYSNQDFPAQSAVLSSQGKDISQSGTRLVKYRIPSALMTTGYVNLCHVTTTKVGSGGPFLAAGCPSLPRICHAPTFRRQLLGPHVVFFSMT